MARGTADFNGHALRFLRLSRPIDGRLLSAADLAERLGTSKSRILAYENNTSTPERGRISQIATLFQVLPAELSLSDAGYYSIHDMRCHAGLTAAQTASVLHISRSAYRDIEHLALLPVRDDGTLPLKLATTMGVPLNTIHQALEQHPVAAARRSQITDHLTQLFQRAHETHVPTVIDPQDPRLEEISHILRRPTSVVCRLVNHEVAFYRQLLKSRAVSDVDAAYAQSKKAAEQARASNRRVVAHIETAPARSASNLNRFLAEAVSSRQWRTMVHMFNSERAAHNAPAAYGQDADEEATWAVLRERGFVGRRYQLTQRGHHEIRTQAPRYACLYPRVPAPRRLPPQRLPLRTTTPAQ
ncbi:helix-turn-helix domain-containing protein [Streptomyces milbemycinicus]|uniref:Helix-turn-helix domain-containing protein n=1 Tax=Streptomyces milbemycinicus TaxID=476552 RepID=A0ABW8M316_9ACTN